MKARNQFLRTVVGCVLIALLAITASPSRALTRYQSPALAVFQQLSVHPNIETAGIIVSGENLPETASLFYRPNEASLWQAGHPLTRMDDGRLAGSLFGLTAGSSYLIRVSDGTQELSGSFTTLPDSLSFTPSSILYVNDDAPVGGNGTASAPYRTIQEAVDRATPGTQVLVSDGIYREAVTFPVSGTPNNWIQVKAAGTGAILEGADTITGKKWTALSGVNKVWFMKPGRSIAYLARDKNRYYNYDTLAGLKKAVGHGNVSMKEGWYYEAATGKLYVRSLDNPSIHSWQIPRHNHAFDVINRNWIWIEGFEIRFYGTRTDGCGVCALNASQLVVRNNRIHHLQLGIFINWNGTVDQGNDTRIESNEIYDPPVDTWPWKAVKGSTMEGTAIILRGHNGAIVRGNYIHNYFNGVYTGSSAANALENPEVAFDADIYNNRIQNISDDAFEPEGACVNHRFRNNTVDRVLVGVSIAPVTQGPVWVMRNTIANFTSTSFKWALTPDGKIFIYHNTSWTNAAGLNAMSVITPFHNSVMRNNIFQGNGYAFDEAFTGSTGNDWNFDNWYTTRGTTGPHFRWENIAYSSMPLLCAATGLECNGHEKSPGLVNPTGGNFALLAASPNIDAGILIPGINDGFTGSAPDIGAMELGN